LEDQGVDERIILRWISVNWDVGAWTVSITTLTVGADGGKL
jgi:hypothetical protein